MVSDLTRVGRSRDWGGRLAPRNPGVYTCVMASIYKQTIASPGASAGRGSSAGSRAAPSPRQALRRRSRLDALLDPETMRVLGEPTRARLLACLLKCARPCSVTEVAECCSIDFSMVARHLAQLARVGLVSASKRGRTVWYVADAAALAGRFRALADAIDELGPCPCGIDGVARGAPAGARDAKGSDGSMGRCGEPGQESHTA